MSSIFFGAGAPLLRRLFAGGHVGAHVGLHPARFIHAGRVNLEPTLAGCIIGPAHKCGASHIGNLLNRYMGGKPVRNFALSRAPELAQLQAGFGALLSGDRALLETQYQLAPQGTRQQWTLLLTPIDAKLKTQLHDITLHGQGEELRCIETRPAKGDLQRTLLGSAAKSAATNATTDALVSLCHGG